MKINWFRATNFRSFTDSGKVELKNMNILIGANNTGKSSVLRALHIIQQGQYEIYGDVRVGAREAKIEISLTDITGQHGWTNSPLLFDAVYHATIISSDRRSGEIKSRIDTPNGRYSGDPRLPNIEPDHFIVPFLSKRKTLSYNEDIREQFVRSISSDLSNLTAKLSRISNPAFPAHPAYSQACKEILGFVVTAIPSPNGQRPGIYLPDLSTIPIDQMGEGVPNIAYMLACIATSKNKLFLIEEPENDLHPSALKALLDLIIESSKENQFVISTHSNIVVQHLCGIADSQLLKIYSPESTPPSKAIIKVVPETPEARIAVLHELGYSFADFDLWDGWLILEESSAERIIRDYLIPWFAPKLRRIRTISAGGVDKVEPALNDFMRMMVYTHLQPVYANRTWVRVDNDEPGNNVVLGLRNSYKKLPDNRFKTFPHNQFEFVYPKQFTEEVKRVLAISDRRIKREEKRKLLDSVLAWLNEDEVRAKQALAESAALIIEDLVEIEKTFIQHSQPIKSNQ